MDERRRQPRFAKRLALEVSASGAPGMGARSENLSLNGLNCTVPEYIEPFSKLTVSLNLADKDGNPLTVACEGVVVRVEPETPAQTAEGYGVSIYFTDLSPETAEAIDGYLSLPEG